MTGPFRLFPEGQRWWSLADYGAVLSVMQRLQPKRVLEFGPGSSTLALVEGGAEHIDCCEDKPAWFDVYYERLELVYPVVKMRRYVWTNPVDIPELNGHRYDLALIDGPHGTLNRPAVIEYALQRCAVVMVARENWSTTLNATAWAAPLPKVCDDLASQYGRPIEIIETGPTSGSFALIGAQ